MRQKTIDVEFLSTVLSYDPETGFLTRKNDGSQACYVGSEGYRNVFVDKVFLAHRVSWALHHGVDPGAMQIDHINGDRSDNRAANLRIATGSENMWNRGVSRNNTSGFKGVKPYRGRYRARIYVKSKEIHLGDFDSATEAHAAYLKAAEKYHGEFAGHLSKAA